MGAGNPDQDNDNIGSLPMSAGAYSGQEAAESAAGDKLEPANLSIVLTGTQAELHAAVLEVQGGSMQVSMAGLPGQLTLVVSDPDSLVLDSEVIARGRVLAALHLGPKLDGGVAAIDWDGLWTTPFGLSTQTPLLLPLGKIYTSLNKGLGQVALHLVYGSGAQVERGLVQLSSLGAQLHLDFDMN